MKITIDGTEYRLFFRYKWEQPGGVSRKNGTIELRNATWTEVYPEFVRQTKFPKLTDRPGTKWVGDLWRTTEAILARVEGTPEGETRPVYTEIAKGVTRCSPLDKFSKDHGRLESLRRLQEALRTKGFTGPQLGEIHAAYQASRPIRPKNLKQAVNKIVHVVKLVSAIQQEEQKADPDAAQKRKELGI